MVHRRLGRAGFRVSPVGWGAFKIGRNEQIKYPGPYELPTEAACERLLNGIVDLGINYIDTAPAYGLSEDRIGRALARRRGELVLSTKVGETFEDGRSHFDFSNSAVRRSVQRSLNRLQTDVVDILFIHSNGDDRAVLEETDVVEAVHDLRDAGLVRAIGFSGKTIDGARAAMAWADVLMVEFHLDDESHGPVIAAATEAGIGIVVKKGLASGRLPGPEAIRFVLSNAGVGSLVIGGLDLDHVRENIRIAEGM